MMVDADEYKTIAELAEAEFKDRGSKFIGFVKPISDEQDFQAFVNEIKSLHFKARHHCFAFRYLDVNQFRYSDDGEPSGTAGRPIYNQLLSYELVDIACIVVRYFGGTKLGTSGLINAYKEAAKGAIENANIVTKKMESTIRISFDYAVMGAVMNALKHLDLNISSTDFGAAPSLELRVGQSKVTDSKLMLIAFLLNRPIADVDLETEVEGLRIDE